MITIGDKARWWNRKVPILRIAACVVLLVIAIRLFPYLAYPASDLWWGVTHRWTAQYRGRTFHLPFMWRQEDQQLGGMFYLRNSVRRGLTYLESDVISVHDSTSNRFDPTLMGQRWRQLLPSLAGKNDTAEMTWGDSSVRSAYDCIALHDSVRRSYRITCFANDGRWIVDFGGSKASISDFEEILANVSRLPDPLVWPK